ncbi:MAG: hypothetical protein R3C52_09175 [Hyphomonadaceae bacterium]
MPNHFSADIGVLAKMSESELLDCLGKLPLTEDAYLEALVSMVELLRVKPKLAPAMAPFAATTCEHFPSDTALQLLSAIGQVKPKFLDTVTVRNHIDKWCERCLDYAHEDSPKSRERLVNSLEAMAVIVNACPQSAEMYLEIAYIEYALGLDGELHKLLLSPKIIDHVSATDLEMLEDVCAVEGSHPIFARLNGPAEFIDMFLKASPALAKDFRPWDG